MVWFECTGKLTHAPQKLDSMPFVSCKLPKDRNFQSAYYVMQTVAKASRRCATHHFMLLYCRPRAINACMPQRALKSAFIE